MSEPTSRPAPLLSATDLREALSRKPAPLVLDCSFHLADPAAGERDYLAGHVPGAQYAHLDRDLSGPKTGPDGLFRGRHPLPSRESCAAWLGRLGVTPDRPVVAYDRQGGMYAARAWWLLRWMGHTEVAVLDGGWQAWLATSGTIASGQEPAPSPAAPYPKSD